MPFEIGVFVKIHGLVKAPVYNGKLGVIIQAVKTEDERWPVQVLDHADGWERSQSKRIGGNQIKVKESNLTLSDRDSEAWRASKIDGGYSLLEKIRATDYLTNLQDCHEFCQGVWDCLSETIPGVPLTVDHGNRIRDEILDATGHKLFWLQLEGIQHHVLIEKCNGRYRVFQCYVKPFPGAGYTAGEWCHLSSSISWNTAHKTCGGGLTVGDETIKSTSGCHCGSSKSHQTATTTFTGKHPRDQ